MRGRASASSVLVFERHPSPSVAPEVGPCPRFDVGRCEDAGFRPIGVDQGRIELLNGVGVLIASRRVEELGVHGRVEAEDVGHLVDGGRGHRLKEHVREGGNLVYQVVGVEDHPSDCRSPDLQSIVRIGSSHIIA